MNTKIKLSVILAAVLFFHTSCDNGTTTKTEIDTDSSMDQTTIMQSDTANQC